MVNQEEEKEDSNVIQLVLPKGRKYRFPDYCDRATDFIDYSTAPEPTAEQRREIQQQYWGIDEQTNRADRSLNPYLRKLKNIILYCGLIGLTYVLVNEEDGCLQTNQNRTENNLESIIHKNSSATKIESDNTFKTPYMEQGK